MDKETIEFYDRESAFYSAKRYPDVTANFTQYLFKTRSKLFLNLLNPELRRLLKSASIMEVGCADGILFAQIEGQYPERFGQLIGMDVSPKMVEVAERSNTNPRASFCLRESLPNDKYDVVVELGVHPFDLENELNFVKNHLKEGGLFFYSVVGSGSLYTRLKMSNARGTTNYLKYSEYESVFAKHFDVVDSRAYGLFVPKLWAWPSLARLIQPIADLLLKPFVPELFHEKVYVLRSKAK